MGLTKVSTDGVKDDAITAGKIPANAIGVSELASSSVTNVKVAAGNVDNTAIGNNQVSLNKLVQGTSSNDGKFLRANNGANPSFESLPAGITVNNQADNRVITATGTTDTLNAESNVVIDSSGNLGIAVTPSDLLHLKFGTNLHMRFNSGVDSLPTINAQQDAGAYNGLGIRADNLRFHTGTTPAERMRILNNGDIVFGTTAVSGFSEKFRFFTNVDEPVINIDSASTGTAAAVILRHARGGLSGFNGKAFSFVGNDNTEEGSIVIHTTSTAFNTSSDYRLKENEVAISDGITRLKQLKPYQFNFKKEPDVKVDGFFAHEVSSIVPIAVSGEKDAVKEDGSIEPQGIDQSKLVPLLTAALQEAVAKIEVLETKVAALEAKS